MLLTALMARLFMRPTKQYLHEAKLRDRIEELGGHVELTQTNEHGFGPHVGGVIRKLGGGRFLNPLGERIMAVAFSNTKVTEEDIKAFAECKRLQHLLLANADLTDDSLKPLAGCTSLKTLEITHNPKVTDKGVQNLVNHQHLRNFRVTGTRVSNTQYRKILENNNSFKDGSIDTLVSGRSRLELESAELLKTDRTNTATTISLSNATDLPRMLEHVQSCLEVYLTTGMSLTVELMDEQLSDEVFAALVPGQATAEVGSNFHRLILHCTEHTNEATLQRAVKMGTVSLELQGLVVPEDLTPLQNATGLTELSFPKASNIASDDIISLGTIPELKILRVPHAIISEDDLRELMANPPFELETFQLPDQFQDLRFEIVESKLAATVTFPSDMRLANAWDERFARPVHRSFNKNVNSFFGGNAYPPGQQPLSFFLGEAGNSFQDFLVLSANSDGELSESYIKHLNQISERLPLTQTPIDEVTADAKTWRKPVEKLPLDAMLLRTTWGSLITNRIKNGDIAHALDLAVRVLALWPALEHFENANESEPTFEPQQLDSVQRVLAELCNRTPDTDETQPMKRLMFMVADQEETTWEKPGELLGPWNRIGILAPIGMELVHLSSTHERLDIVVNKQVWFRGKNIVDLPANTRQLFVSPESFPLTIKSSSTH